MSTFSGASPYFSVDFLGLKGLERLDRETELLFHGFLLQEVPKAVDAVIKNAQSQLQPGHGYDTGLLHDTLTKTIITISLTTGVIYSLQSEKAVYWKLVEEGYIHTGGEFIPGLRFFANAIAKNHGRMGMAAARAWRKTQAVLNARAMLPVGVTKLL